MVLSRGEEYDVSVQYLCTPLRDDRLKVTLDSDDVEYLISRPGQLMKVFAYNVRTLTHLHTHQNQSPIEQLHVLTCPRVFDGRYYLPCSQQLGVNHGMDSHIAEVLCHVGFEEFVVVDACQRFSCSQS